MKTDSSEQEPAFKVVDKRRFNDEGEARAERPEPRETPQASPKFDDKARDSMPASRPAISFTLFIQSLAHQAMMGLGIVPWPEGLVRKELAVAKETIDILVMLKEKSAGNLSTEEQSFFDALLYQLQRAYVDISQNPDGTLIK